MQINDTTISVVRGSVLDQDVDAIVNAANTRMRGGGGVDGAIHAAAGKALLKELTQVAPQGAPTGTAVLTHGHNLKQPYVIHTPGPVWRGGRMGERDLLWSAYHSCLDVADQHHLASIAFCSISTGVYGYPLEQAAPVALRTVRKFFEEHPRTSIKQVVFAMYAEEEYRVFSEALTSLSA